MRAVLTSAVDWLYASLVSTESAPGLSLAVQIALSASLLLTPTTLMGATFPFLTEFFRGHSSDHKGWKVGLLYASNTIGAAVGATVVGFLLIELIGERGSTYVAALANFGAALIALRLDAPIRPAEPDLRPSNIAPATRQGGGRRSNSTEDPICKL